MNKLFVFSLIASFTLTLSCMFTACSGDDPVEEPVIVTPEEPVIPDNPVSNSIVGTWAYLVNGKPIDIYIFNANETFRRIETLSYGDLEEYSGTYSYDEVTGKLIVKWHAEYAWEYVVKEIDNERLTLDHYYNGERTESRMYFKYNGELPTPLDYSDVINRAWVNTTYNFEYITLMQGGTVDYKWLTNDLLAYYNINYRGAKAKGTYTLEGSKLTINLGAVKVDAYGYYDDWIPFHGFEDGKSCTREYYIKSCDGNTLVMKDEDYVECTYVRAEKYTPKVYGTDVSGTANGHDYVDLGLSVKWATTYIGATAPQDYGNKTFNFAEAGSADDPAVKEWGGNWRLPTLDEVKELSSKCTVKTLHSNTDHYDLGYQFLDLGYIVTGPNGKSLYFSDEGSTCGWVDCLTGTRKNDSQYYCLRLSYSLPIADYNYYSNNIKCLVRPVLAE